MAFKIKIRPRYKAVMATLTLAGVCFAQKDPGVRAGAPGAGGPVPGIQINELALFNEGRFRMTELESVCDGCADVTPGNDTGQNPFLQTLTNSSGLGARFNGDQCIVCHAQPSIGGSGGFFVPNPQDPVSKQRKPENPMFDLIPHRKGGRNTVPSFITQYGPIREVRFVSNPDGTPDGGVHQLFTVVGRTDTQAPGCNITQPDFETQYRNKNLGFRIPLQLFGLGLIDSIQDSEILSHFNATASARSQLGIAGTANRSGNDGTITRFGWKAQNKSLTMFSGEAYNVEMGVTNELFPQATEELATCNGLTKNHPNDVTRTDTNDSRNQGYNTPAHLLADWMQFTLFMRFVDGPTPVALSSSAQRGQQLFGTSTNPYGGAAIGCAVCHTPSMITAPAMESAALQNRQANLLSDLLTHHMGPGLADNITQGKATGDMFRSTPLWGVGQRIFFLHDGRTSDLLAAIAAHSSYSNCGDGGGDNNNQGNFNSQNGDGGGNSFCYGDSEANKVIDKFNGLSKTDKQAMLDYLRSL